MSTLEALIFRRLIKDHMPGIGNNKVAISGSDAIEMLNAMLETANESIKQSANDYRRMVELMSQAEKEVELICMGGL